MALPPARKWWPMSLMRESLATRSCSTPTSRSRGLLRSKLRPETGERLSSLSAPWHQNYSATPGRRHRRARGRNSPSPRPEEDQPRRQGPTYLMELPRFKLSGATKLASYSSPAPQSVFARRCHCWDPWSASVEPRRQTCRRTPSPAWNSTACPQQSREVGATECCGSLLGMHLSQGAGPGTPGGLASCPRRDPRPRTCTTTSAWSCWLEAAMSRGQLYCVFQSNISVKPPRSRALFHFRNVRIWGREYFVIFVWIRTERLYCIMYYLGWFHQGLRWPAVHQQ